MVSAALRKAFLQPEAASSSQTWRHVADQMRGKGPKLAGFMDENEHDVLAYMTFPAQRRVKLHKGHDYVTVVCDLIGSTVEYVADERKAESLKGYYWIA